MFKIVGIVIALLSSFAQADSDQSLVEGVSPNKVITGYMWYGCGHCYELEKKLVGWLEENPHITVQKRPASASRVWERHAKLFYTIESLGLSDKVHDKVFELIHEEGSRMLFDEEWGLLLRQYNPDLTDHKIQKIAESFSVASQIQKDKKAMRDLEIMGVPALVINGELYSAGDYESLDELLRSVKAAVSELP